MGNERKKRNLKKLTQALFLIIGVVLILFGISLIFWAPRIIDSKIREHKNLMEGSQLYKFWKDPDYKIRSDIYVYSVRNRDQILNGSKPEVTTIGPYVYQISQKKNIVGFGKGTIKYQTTRYFIFNENASCTECLPDRKIWIPNIVFQKFVEVASNPITSVAQSALISQSPFLEISVEDILFKGYKDPYLTDVCTAPLMDLICESVLELPEKIGFLTNRNGTHKVIEASTGELDGGGIVGEIISWDGKKLLPQNWWDTTAARKINGSDGEVYKSHIKKTDTIYVFVPDLCRSIYLTYDEEFEYKGIPAYRFTVKEDFMNPEVPGNEGFCHNSGKEIFWKAEKCLPKGLLDLSRCYAGAPPVIFSFPNFLYADSVVKESVIGLQKSSVSHDGIIVEVEPRTGTLLRVYRRSQINIAIWKGRGISFGIDLSRMRNGIVPLLAEYELVEIGDGSLAALQKVTLAKQTIMFLCFLSILIGSLLVLVAIFLEILLKTKLKTNGKVEDGSFNWMVTRIAVRSVPTKKNAAFEVGTT